MIGLIGAPTDINSSFLRGPALAPPLIRKMMFSDMGNIATESGLELGETVKFTDYGDLPLTEGAGDDDLITSQVTTVMKNGDKPLILGGDHAITYPILKAIAAAHGPVSILHIDAHPDLYDNFDDNPRSHASPFARILEDGLASRLVQVGIRTLNQHQREQAERFGVEILPMRKFDPDSVPELNGPVYISIDMDGLDPAYAPGVSHIEPGGLSVRQVLDILYDVKGDVVGADVVEYNPTRDRDDVTAVVAAKLAKELCALLAR